MRRTMNRIWCAVIGITMHFGQMADHFSQWKKQEAKQKFVRMTISRMKSKLSSNVKNSLQKMTMISIVWLFVCHSHRDSDHGIFITPASCYLCWSHHHMTTHSNVSITCAVFDSERLWCNITTGTIHKFLSKCGQQFMHVFHYDYY